MSSTRTAVRPLEVSLAAVTMIACLASPAAAQNDPNPGAITIAGAMDFTNAYMFRGIPQDESGVIMQPYFDLGLALRSADQGLKSLGVNFGTWNSLHTGDAGLDGSTGRLWYESDFYATLALGFGGGMSAGATYTAYTSPNGLFTTVKEISFRVGADDSAYLGQFSLKPYALFAFELDTEPGVGQADGGLEAGKYLELGVAPGYSFSHGSVSVPLKVGLSMGDYYETVDPLAGTSEDETFGFFSIAGSVSIPFTAMPTKFGTWNVHGGVEYQRLGDRNALILGNITGADGPENNQVIYSVGVGFTY
ncbi:MAG TPA: hypothetical protein VFV95_07515 [Vicinamibacterales bacterium]|nr:hypothetical protein [Vicinamibacterales bacterium]